jgi:2-oxoglutarate ferredoxin oxidoreductase subunit beta
MTEMIKEAVRHPGFAVVEVMSPCVTFNKVNTYKWFKENVYHLDDEPGYDQHDKQKAFATLTAPGKIPLGIFYREIRPTLDALTLRPESPAISSLPIETIDPRLATLQDAYA